MPEAFDQVLPKDDWVDVPRGLTAANLAKVLGIPVGEIRASVAVKGEGVIEVFNAVTAEVLRAFFTKTHR